MESAQSQLVTITPKAAEKVAEFMKQEGKNDLFLRGTTFQEEDALVILRYGI